MYSNTFSDIYFSLEGGVEEKRHVFVDGNNLLTKFGDMSLCTICELGFGAGCSFIATFQAWRQKAISSSKLHYIGIERYPLCADVIKKIFESLTEFPAIINELLPRYSAIDLDATKRHTIRFSGEDVVLDLIFLDVLEALSLLKKEGTYVDAWYLDGFSPKKNPDMWLPEVFKMCRELSAPHATLATYSVARKVRDDLEAAGFICQRVKGFGSKRNALIAHI